MHSGFYAGHGSWAVAAIFLLTIALRLGFGSRRRQGRPQPPGRAPGFQSARPADRAAPTAAPAAPPTAETAPPDQPVSASASAGDRAGAIGSSGIAPGWLVDPTGRHELRYWSGTGWTEHVSDRGVPATDDPPTT
ncbi:MAG TPA: DUF2510 domain-containing protein [Acidimicrobiales bacterium]|nr:DUF2510 domain-containing protein [Acidimicrobiales bacterium]